MEHEHSVITSTSNMVIKNDTPSFPDGSPLLSEPVAKMAILNSTTVIDSGKVSINGGSIQHQEIVPAEIPLQVQVNGFKQPNSGPMSPVIGPLSAASTSLPLDYSPSISDNSPSVPKGDLCLPTPNALNDAVKFIQLPETSSNSNSPRVSISGLTETGFAVPQIAQRNGSQPGTSAVIPASSKSVMPSGTVAVPPVKQPSQENVRRRHLIDKINRASSRSYLNFTVPQLENANTMHLALVMRRARRLAADREDLPLTSEIFRTVYEEPTLTDQKIKKARLEINRGDDGDVTDLSDYDFDPDAPTSSVVVTASLPAARIAEERARFASQDHRLTMRISDSINELQRWQKQLEENTLTEDRLLFERSEGEETCARVRCLVSRTAKHRIYRHTFRDVLHGDRDKVDYTSMQPSTSNALFVHTDSMDQIAGVPQFDREMQTHIHWLSMVPSATVRKRVDRPTYLNVPEIKEERTRNGWKRYYEKQQRINRQERRERELRDKKNAESSEYEDTDDTDDEYQPKVAPAPVKKARSSKRRGKSGREKERSRKEREPAGPLFKPGRRTSVAVVSRSASAYDDMYQPDSLLSTHLPKNLEYKEIEIPQWFHSKRTEVSDFGPSADCEFCVANDLLAEVQRNHDMMEEQEQNRFAAMGGRTRRRTRASASMDPDRGSADGDSQDGTPPLLEMSPRPSYSKGGDEMRDNITDREV